MLLIDLREWNITYTDLTKWCEDTGADVYAVIYHGANNSSATYAFEKEEDMLAFKLAFSRVIS